MNLIQSFKNISQIYRVNVLIFIASFCLGLGGILILFNFFSPKQPEKLISPHLQIESSSYSPILPPSESLIGDVSFLNGDVFWQSREATTPAKIKNLTKIEQGESIKTNLGVVDLNFPNTAKLIVSADSNLNIIQTLPVNLVFAQTQGTVEYNSIGNSPIDIRALHLLIHLVKGDCTITLNKDQNLVIVLVRDGTVTMAFNDLNFVSNLYDLPAPNRYIFDDTTRTGIKEPEI